MSDSDDDYDDTVDDKVYPHPWERVFDEYKGEVDLKEGLALAVKILAKSMDLTSADS